MMMFHDDKIYYDYIMSWLGVPYIWGGQSRMGVDCSGLLQRLLDVKGLDPPGDQTAQGLFNHFQKEGQAIYLPAFGALVFFGSKIDTIKHVGMCLNADYMLEAKGGGPSTLTPTAGASVEVSRIHRRNDIQGVFLPYNSLFINGQWPHRAPDMEQ